MKQVKSFHYVLGEGVSSFNLIMASALPYSKGLLLKFRIEVKEGFAAQTSINFC